MSRCPWKVHWGVSQESTTQCDRDDHLGEPVYRSTDGRAWWRATADLEHRGLAANGITVINWLAGDRREYTGDWPGPCPHQPCILHAGHFGNHAP